MSISDIQTRTGAKALKLGWPQIAFAIILASLLVVPLAINNAFVSHVFITICLFAALSTAWNIVGGFEGAPDANAQRGHQNGWRHAGLPWRQN